MSKISQREGWAWKLGSFLAALILAQAVTGAETNSAPRPSGLRRPSIILIVADDLGYGDLGSYGQKRIKTPNLDRLAKEGTRFTSFYAGSTVCAPSRCTLMTGLHTGHALIRGNANVPLEAGQPTLARALQQAGYWTGLVGKWGLGNENTMGVPQKQGFNEFVGFLDQTHAHDYYPTYLWRFDPHTGFDDKIQLIENHGNQRRSHVQDLFTSAAMNFARINAPGKVNLYRPFFLYLAYTTPHANNEEGRRTGNGMQVSSDAPYSNEGWPQPEKNKAAMITQLDADIGRLLEKLKKLGIDDNTLILFTSDNGPHKEGGVKPEFFQSSGSFRGLKRDLYEGGIRVPMIAWWPGKVPTGKVSDQIWTFWDVFPTLAEIGNAQVPKTIDGISMVPALTGKAQTNQHVFLYWEFHEGGSKQAVRMGDWKGVRLAPGAKLELFNLKNDPSEKSNVAAANSEIVAKIDNYLKTARTESTEWPLKPGKAEASETTSEKK
jgi:arylsulfatase A-like enzyme